MKRVYKYQLTLGKNIISLPKNSRVIHFDSQKDNPTMWAMVFTETEYEEREFYITVTGADVPENYSYIGTAKFDNDTYIGHLFEVLND